MKIVDPLTSSSWAKLASSAPSATLFHTPQWMRVVQDTYGLKFSASTLEREGEPSAGVCWSDVEDFLGDRRISLPFSDFCDILASDPNDARELAEHVMAAGRPWTLRTSVGNMPQIAVEPSSSTAFKWQAIDLSPDPDAMWSRLSSAAQRGIRKAQKSNVEVHDATSKLELREWFLLHLRLRKEKYGLLAQPYSFFENIWDSFIANGQGYLSVATVDGKIVAGILFLYWNDTCYYKFNASDSDHLALRPNNLLMWQGILKAKEDGYRCLDLGRSSVKQEGLVAYKRSYGAHDEDMYSVTYPGVEDESNGTKQARDLLHGLTKLLVQDSVTEQVAEDAGALLYRYFV
jgi:CelD/BcsL family acetyltransferase involved in cellulose biosynthesis